LILEVHMKLFKLTNKVTLLVLIFLPVLAIAGLPDPGMSMTQGRTALVLTDPQNDFLSPKGVTWGVVRDSVTANKTVKAMASTANMAVK
ncbi:MAG: cysteine hydrolase, partial [Bacteroidota bacterium]